MKRADKLKKEADSTMEKNMNLWHLITIRWISYFPIVRTFWLVFLGWFSGAKYAVKMHKKFGGIIPYKITHEICYFHPGRIVDIWKYCQSTRSRLGDLI